MVIFDSNLLVDQRVMSTRDQWDDELGGYFPNSQKLILQWYAPSFSQRLSESRLDITSQKSLDNPRISGFHEVNIGELTDEFDAPDHIP